MYLSNTPKPTTQPLIATWNQDLGFILKGSPILGNELTITLKGLTENTSYWLYVKPAVYTNTNQLVIVPDDNSISAFEVLTGAGETEKDAVIQLVESQSAFRVGQEYLVALRNGGEQEKLQIKFLISQNAILNKTGTVVKNFPSEDWTLSGFALSTADNKVVDQKAFENLDGQNVKLTGSQDIEGIKNFRDNISLENSTLTNKLGYPLIEEPNSLPRNVEILIDNREAIISHRWSPLTSVTYSIKNLVEQIENGLKLVEFDIIQSGNTFYVSHGVGPEEVAVSHRPTTVDDITLKDAFIYRGNGAIREPEPIPTMEEAWSILKKYPDVTIWLENKNAITTELIARMKGIGMNPSRVVFTDTSLPDCITMKAAGFTTMWVCTLGQYNSASSTDLLSVDYIAGDKNQSSSLQTIGRPFFVFTVTTPDEWEELRNTYSNIVGCWSDAALPCIYYRNENTQTFHNLINPKNHFVSKQNLTNINAWLDVTEYATVRMSTERLTSNESFHFHTYLLGETFYGSLNINPGNASSWNSLVIRFDKDYAEFDNGTAGSRRQAINITHSVDGNTDSYKLFGGTATLQTTATGFDFSKTHYYGFKRVISGSNAIFYYKLSLDPSDVINPEINPTHTFTLTDAPFLSAKMFLSLMSRVSGGDGVKGYIEYSPYNYLARAENRFITENATITGTRTFANPVSVPSPTADDNAVNRAYTSNIQPLIITETIKNYKLRFANAPDYQTFALSELLKEIYKATKGVLPNFLAHPEFSFDLSDPASTSFYNAGSFNGGDGNLVNGTVATMTNQTDLLFDRASSQYINTSFTGPVEFTMYGKYTVTGGNTPAGVVHHIVGSSAVFNAGVDIRDDNRLRAGRVGDAAINASASGVNQSSTANQGWAWSRKMNGSNYDYKLYAKTLSLGFDLSNSVTSSTVLSSNGNVQIGARLSGDATGTFNGSMKTVMIFNNTELTLARLNSLNSLF